MNRIKEKILEVEKEIAIAMKKQEAVEKNKRLGMCSQQWISLQNHMASLQNHMASLRNDKASLQNQIVELTKRLGVKEDKLESKCDSTKTHPCWIVFWQLFSRFSEIIAPFTQGLIESTGEQSLIAFLLCVYNTSSSLISCKTHFLVSFFFIFFSAYS